MAIFDENGNTVDIGAPVTEQDLANLQKSMAVLSKDLESHEKATRALSETLAKREEETKRAKRDADSSHRERVSESQAQKAARSASPVIAKEAEVLRDRLTQLEKQQRAVTDETAKQGAEYKALTSEIAITRSRFEKINTYLEQKARTLYQQQRQKVSPTAAAHQARSARARVSYYEQQEREARLQYLNGTSAGSGIGERAIAEQRKQLEESRKIYERKAIEYITQNIANGTLTEAMLKLIPHGKAVPIPVKLNTQNGAHNYQVVGPHKQALSKALPEGHTYSATELAGILSGKKIDTSEEHEAKLLEERRRGGLSKERSAAITEELKTIKNFRQAAVRGTAFHKLVELMENGSLRPGKNGSFSVEQIQQMAQSGHPLYSDELKVAARKNDAQQFAKMLKDYSDLKAQMGIEGQATTERSLGAVLKIGDKLVKVAGTLDSYYAQSKFLGDTKTTSSLHAQENGFQLNFMRYLAGVNGLGDVSQMGIFHVPFNERGRTSGVASFEEMSEDKLVSLIAKAVRVAENGEQLSGDELSAGQIRSQFVTKQEGKYPISYLNNVSMAQLPQVGIEEVLRQLRSLPLDELSHFINALFSTKEYLEDGTEKETDKFYRGSKGQKEFWDELRSRVPSFFKELAEGTLQNGIGYRSYIVKDPKTGEDGVQGGTTIGGGYLSQWSTAYRTAMSAGNTRGADEIIKTLLNLLNNEENDRVLYEIFRKIDELPDRDEIHSSFRNAVMEKISPTTASGMEDFRYGLYKEEEARLRAVQEEQKKMQQANPNQHYTVYTDKDIEDLLDSFVKDMSTGAPDGKVSDYSRLYHIANDSDQGRRGVKEQTKEESQQSTLAKERAIAANIDKQYQPMFQYMKEVLEFDFSSLSVEKLEKTISDFYQLSEAAKAAYGQIGATENAELNEEGVPLYIEKSREFLDEYESFVRFLSQKFKSLASSLSEEDFGRLSEKLKNALAIGENLPKLNEQTAHRFSWLYMAQEEYERALRPELDRYNSNNNASMSMSDFAKLRLSKEQYAQYSDSIKLRQMGQNLGAEDLLSRFDSDGEFNWESELASGVKRSIPKLIEGIPDLFYSKFFEIIGEQTDLNGGAAQKLNHWHGLGVEDRLLHGDILRSYSSDYEAPSYTPEQYVDRIISKLETEIGARESVFSSDGSIEELKKQMRESAEAGEFLTKIYKPAVTDSDSVTDPLKAIATYDDSVDWKSYEDALESMRSFMERFGSLRTIRARAKQAGLEGLEDVMTGEGESVLGLTSQEDIDQYYKLADQYTEQRERIAAASREGWGKMAFKRRRELYSDYGYPIRQAQQNNDLRNEYYQSSGQEGEIAVMRQMIEELRSIREEYRLMRERQQQMISSGMLLPSTASPSSKVNNVPQTPEEPSKEAESATEQIVEDHVSEVVTKAVKTVSKRTRKKKSKPNVPGSGDGSILDVHATSNTPQDTTGYKEISRTMDDRGNLIGVTIAKAVQKVFADYGEKGLLGYIKDKQALGDTEENRKATRNELMSILSKVPSYGTSAGTLKASGEKERQKIMEAIYGDSAKADTRITTPNVIIEGSPANVTLTGSPVNLDSPVLNANTSVINIAGEVTLNGNVSGGFGKKGDGDSDGGSPKKPDKAEEQSEIRLAKYLELLKQIQQVELDIFKIEKQLESARARSDDAEVAGLEGRKGDLETLKQQLEDDKHAIDQGDFTSVFSDKQQLRIKDTLDRYSVSGPAAQAKYESSHTLEDQISNERELQKLLNQRLGLEEKISSEQKTINTSFSGQEKNALARLISMQKEEVGLLDEKIQKLLASGNLRKEELKEIVRQYQIQQQTRQAQAAAKDHGSMSLFDKMKFDVQRSITRVLDYGFSMRLLNSIPRGLNKIYQITVQLDDALTSLRIVTGMNRKEAEATMITYQKLGKELGATTQEVAQSATAWLRQGYSVQEAGNLIDASMKLSKLGFMQADQATQVLTASLKGFKLEVGNALDVVDKLTQMDQKAAVSAQGVSEALSLMANSARLAGLSINQAIAMVSTVGEVTQQSMSTVGNSMKTMLARFGNVKAGAFSSMSEDGEDATESINDTEKVLRTLGISIRTASGEMRDFDDVLADVAEKWNTLDTVSKNAVAGALGGVRQREGVVTLLENYDRYIELTKEAEESEGTANKKYEAYMDSMEAHLKRLQNTWEKFVQQLEASPIIKLGINFLTGVIDNMDTLVSLVSTLGATFLAVKIPGWLQKFGENNFGGGRVGNFFGTMLGGNDGFIGSGINDKRESSIRSKYNSLLGVGGDDELDSIMASYDYDPDMYKDDAGYKARKATLESERDKEIAESRLVKDKNVFDNSTKGAVERGNTILDKIFLLLKKQLEGEKFTAEDESSIDEKHAAQTTKKAMSPKAKRALGAAGAGITAAITAGATKNTVGDSMADKLWNKTGQTVEADVADKAIKGATTGVLAGVGTYFGGPLGGMLGNLLGSTLGDLFTFLRHRGELERKQRVEEAKKQLEALGKIQNTISENSGFITQKNIEGEDLAEARKYVNEMTNLLYENYEVQKRFIEILKKTNQSLGELDFKELMNKLVDGTQEERQQINEALTIATLKEQQKNVIAANEENLANYQELLTGNAIHSGYLWNAGLRVTELRDTVNAGKAEGIITPTDAWSIAVNGSTAEEKKKNAQQFRDNLSKAYSQGNVEGKGDGAEAATLAGLATPLGIGTVFSAADWAAKDAMQLYIKQLDEYIDKLGEAEAAQSKVAQELVDINTQIGFINSHVTQMNDFELQSRTLEGVIDDIADAMEREGIEVRSTSGIIKDQYLSAIKAQISENEKTVKLLKGSALTYNQLDKAQQKFANTLSKINTMRGTNYNYDDLRELLEFADPANKAKIDAIAFSIGMTSEELSSLIYQADPTNIQNLANALHRSVDELGDMRDILQNISLADALMSPEEVKEKFSYLTSYYDDLMSGAALSQNNVSNMIKNHPELLQKTNGNPSELRKEMVKNMLGDNNAQSVLWENATYGELLDSEAVFESFRENNRDLINSLDKDMQDVLYNNKNFASVFDAITNYDGENAAQLKESMEKMFQDMDLQYVSEEHKKIMDAVIKEQTRLIDEQIDNLTKQKDALSEINSERKKELELMKAQEALENAKKEKKMVYRSGVGFVYESDEDAISDAQENLDNLETEREEEFLQMEIDRLELQKEILEYIPTIDELQAQKDTYEAWAETVGESTDALAGMPKIISSISESYQKKFEVTVESLAKLQAQATAIMNGQKVDNVTKYYEQFEKALETLEQMEKDGQRNTFAYNAQVEKVNSYKNKVNSAISESRDAGIDLESNISNFGDIQNSLKNEYKEDAVQIKNMKTIQGGDSSGESGTSFNAQLADTNDETYAVTEGQLKEQFGKDKYTKVLLPIKKDGNGYRYTRDGEYPDEWGYIKDNKVINDWISLSEAANQLGYGGTFSQNSLTELPQYTAVGNQDYDNYYAYIDRGATGDKQMFWLRSTEGGKAFGRMASGTLDLQSNGGWWNGTVNELGTEGIVTPEGTFTALPSHTGIVPADITKNVWKLGEVAPTLIERLGSLKPNGLVPANGNTTNNDGMFIDQLNMTVYPTKDYDMEKFLNEAKAKARITRHNN